MKKTRLINCSFGLSVGRPKIYVISSAEYFKRTHLSPRIIGDWCASPPGKASIHRPGV